MKKRPYYLVKYRKLRDISDNAVAIKCFDGSEAVLPKSQIMEHGLDDALYVPCWLVEKTGVQFAHKQHWM